MITIDLGKPASKSIPSEEKFGSYENVFVRPVSSIPSTSIFLDSQVPQFVREEHPKFIEFMKSYYDWLNLQGQVHYQSKTIKENQDIDTASDIYADMLHQEFIQPLPIAMRADKKQILKYARHFYRSKGTEKSYKLFFRMLYDTNVEFYYPRKDILKVSDGRWTKNKSLRVIGTNIENQNFKNKVVIGQISKCTAFVDRNFLVRTSKGVAQELFLNINSITGKFLPNEIITTEDGAVGTISPVISNIQFTIDATTNKPMQGFGYRVGDEFLVESGSGHKGKIKVASVTTTGAIRRFTITNFGLNYPKTFTMDVDASDIRPIKHLVTQLTNIIQYERQDNDVAILTISDFKSSEGVNRFLKYVERGTLIRVLGQKIFGSLPVGEMEHRFKVVSVSNSSRQVIVEVEPVDKSLPLTGTFVIEQIHSITGSGARINITSDALCDYPGYYVGNNGHISETKYIQDNHFYQQFSYLIYSKECAETYRNYLDSLVHPLGLKFFGGFRDASVISSNKKRPRITQIKRVFEKFPTQKNTPPLSPPGGPLTENDKNYIERDLTRLKNRPRTSVIVKHDGHKELVSSTLGPSNRSIYRERFNYLPRQYSFNNQTIDAPSSYRSDGTIDSTPILTNIDGNTQPYWGNPNTTIEQYANMQIYLFADVIPKSLEIMDVPDIALYKNNSLQKDNVDYIIHDTKIKSNEFTHQGYYQIRLLHSPTAGDTFKVAYKDKFGNLHVKMLPSPSLDSSGRYLIPVLYDVGLLGPNSRINMVPETIITRGVDD